MPRLLFEKTGNAVWISHLDLMRLFQRTFKRAGLSLTHTQGFNPRPSVSIALPLSVGVESKCELLDFELDGENVSNEEIRERLNQVLISGIQVLQVYSDGRKLRDLSLLRCIVQLEYDGGIPEGTEEAIRTLFKQDTLIVPKKTKNGMQDQDIASMIKEFTVIARDNNTLQLNVLICCQNPTLNPMQLSAAISTYLPELKPDFTKCTRLELYDPTGKIFR